MTYKVCITCGREGHLSHACPRARHVPTKITVLSYVRRYGRVFMRCLSNNVIIYLTPCQLARRA